MFRTFALPKNRVEIWRVTVATAAQTTSFFLSIPDLHNGRRDITIRTPYVGENT